MYGTMLFFSKSLCSVNLLFLQVKAAQFACDDQQKAKVNRVLIAQVDARKNATTRAFGLVFHLLSTLFLSLCSVSLLLPFNISSAW